jgi:hypothetical protein
MGCHTIRLSDGTTAIVCGARQKRSKPCLYCQRPSTSQCDYPVFRKNKKGTCDTDMCDDCKQTIGEDLDLCRGHIAVWRNNGKRFAIGGAV